MQAIIFDMDGVIIDSEPFWQQAEVEVFQRYGVPVSADMTLQTMGLRIDLVVDYWFKQYRCDTPKQVLVDEMLARVNQLVSQQGQALPGFHALLQLIKEQGITVGLATSSPLSMADNVIERLGIEGQFDAVNSAEILPYGKPHPQVYLDCAAALGVDPLDCLAIEDSVTGLTAAKAARMTAIAVPPQISFEKPQYGIADTKVTSLEQVNQTLLSQLGFDF
ncbi:2-deoxyglucose-6-phosphate phosphatase [Neiella marina]|uniref:2-deoxyglucose-6-phosphate phosphatase n=1 Tax=Neiella marina TaxID=508461 RepID=A0A8J2U383_9GAMM|nr:hexitol phosphatase HxpB [Neiella marina]GGA70437.1 2-deoxyglucose-6-phosphate phosphatase [Neiella marina]